MKINHKPKIEKIPVVGPLPGDKRTISIFAFLPYRIGNQSRWLERIVVEQKYGCPDVPNCISYEWKDIKFIEILDTSDCEKQ